MKAKDVVAQYSISWANSQALCIHRFTEKIQFVVGIFQYP